MKKRFTSTLLALLMVHGGANWHESWSVSLIKKAGILGMVVAAQVGNVDAVQIKKDVQINVVPIDFQGVPVAMSDEDIIYFQKLFNNKLFDASQCDVYSGIGTCFFPSIKTCTITMGGLFQNYIEDKYLPCNLMGRQDISELSCVEWLSECFKDAQSDNLDDETKVNNKIVMESRTTIFRVELTPGGPICSVATALNLPFFVQPCETTLTGPLNDAPLLSADSDAKDWKGLDESANAGPTSAMTPTTTQAKASPVQAVSTPATALATTPRAMTPGATTSATSVVSTLVPTASAKAPASALQDFAIFDSKVVSAKNGKQLLDSAQSVLDDYKDVDYMRFGFASEWYDILAMLDQFIGKLGLFGSLKTVEIYPAAIKSPLEKQLNKRVNAILEGLPSSVNKIIISGPGSMFDSMNNDEICKWLSRFSAPGELKLPDSGNIGNRCADNDKGWELYLTTTAPTAAPTATPTPTATETASLTDVQTSAPTMAPSISSSISSTKSKTRLAPTVSVARDADTTSIIGGKRNGSEKVTVNFMLLAGTTLFVFGSGLISGLSLL